MVKRPSNQTIEPKKARNAHFKLLSLPNVVHLLWSIVASIHAIHHLSRLYKHLLLHRYHQEGNPPCIRISRQQIIGHLLTQFSFLLSNVKGPYTSGLIAIMSIDKKPVSSASDLNKINEKAEKGGRVDLEVQRKDAVLDLWYEFPKPESNEQTN